MAPFLEGGFGFFNCNYKNLINCQQYYHNRASFTGTLHLSAVPLSPTPAGYSTGSGGSTPDPPAADVLHLRNSAACCCVFSIFSVCYITQGINVTVGQILLDNSVCFTVTLRGQCSRLPLNLA